MPKKVDWQNKIVMKPVDYDIFLWMTSNDCILFWTAKCAPCQRDLSKIHYFQFFFLDNDANEVNSNWNFADHFSFCVCILCRSIHVEHFHHFNRIYYWMRNTNWPLWTYWNVYCHFFFCFSSLNNELCWQLNFSHIVWHSERWKRYRQTESEWGRGRKLSKKLNGQYKWNTIIKNSRRVSPSDDMEFGLKVSIDHPRV